MDLFLNKFRKKIILISLFLTIVVLSGIYLFSDYYSKIKIFQPVLIKIDCLKKSSFNGVEVFALTPNNKVFKFQKNTSKLVWYNDYSFTKSILIKIPDSIFSDIKSVKIKIGKCYYSFNNEEFKNNWKLKYNNDCISYCSPDIVKGSRSAILMLFSIFLWGGYFRIILIFILIILFVLFNYFIFKKIRISFEKIKNITNIYISNNVINIYRHLNKLINNNKFLFFVLLTVFLILFYLIIFQKLEHFDNYTHGGGDSFDYQTMGVNFAKGHGFMVAGGFEKLEVYKLYKDSNDYHKPSIENFYNIKQQLAIDGENAYNRDPAYPLFLGIVYKFWGVCPLIAKQIQLILLIIVSSFLPFIGFCFWKNKGILSGLIASPVFIFQNYIIAESIMTESLIVFVIFLIIIAFIFYDNKKNILSSIILGLIFGIGILVKASLLLIPFLFVIYIWYIAFRQRDSKLFIKSIIIIFTCLFAILPWSIYSNIKSFNNNKHLCNSLINNILRDNGKSEKEIYILIENIKKQNKFNVVFFPNQSNSLLLNGHNEYSPELKDNDYMFIDGGWLPVWKDKKQSFYNNDQMNNSPAIIRVLNFYMHYPHLILKLLYTKIILSFSYFTFLWIIIIVFIIESYETILKTYFKVLNSRGASLIFFSLLIIAIIGIIILNPPLSIKHNYIYCYILAFMLIPLFFKGKQIIKQTQLKIPFIFKIIFINFLLITVIIFGFKRLTQVIDLLIILTSINYLVNYILKLSKKLKTK